MLRKVSCAAMDTSVLHCQFSNYHLQLMVFRGGLDRQLGRSATLSPFRSDIPRILKIRMHPVCAVTPYASSLLRHEVSVEFQCHTRPFVLR
jgi:hypothetical protein